MRAPKEGKSVFVKRRESRPEYYATEIPYQGPTALHVAVQGGPKYNTLAHFLLSHGAGTGELESVKRELLCKALDLHNFSVASSMLQALGMAELTDDDFLLLQWFTCCVS
uniref:Uncharacterized protein n=1 Tax=Eutreptiella gymnastica TaxID=73025 RepID=A0A7S1N8C8_9EUGL|mmetsp:Transcript_136532/g.236959  ORF Transcript_136532/g.236959 Transcript_136532/m.236959 type:complete len:110 (+) Transcript_136532:204-533(+)